MPRMATVRVLKRHTNDYGEQLAKVPEGEAREGAVSAYALPVDQAERMVRDGFVEITAVEPDPDAPAEDRAAEPAAAEVEATTKTKTKRAAK